MTVLNNDLEDRADAVIGDSGATMAVLNNDLEERADEAAIDENHPR